MRSPASVEIRFGPNCRERRHGKAVLRQEDLFADAMLRNRQSMSIRAHDRVGLGGARGGGGHVLELERHDIHALRETTDRIEIIVGRVDLEVGDLSRRRIVLRCERVNAVPKASRGHSEHASKLAAAEDADGGTGVDDGRHFRFQI